MGFFGDRTWNWKKEHYRLEKDDKKVWCSHCGKVIEERDKIPDYAIFMGGVWIKQNLPCKPYNKPVEEANK